MSTSATQLPDTTHHEASPSLADFQQDMRRGYIWGATGIMTSSLVG